MKFGKKALRALAATAVLGSALGLMAPNAHATETRVNTYTPGQQFRANVASSPSGQSVVTYLGLGEGNVYGVYARIYDSNGAAVGNEFPVNTKPNLGGDNGVAMDASGNFVVVYSLYNDDYSDVDMYGQRFNSSGVKQDSEFRVNDIGAGDQANPEVAMDNAGNFCVTWEDFNGRDGSSFGVYARRFNSSGVGQGSDFLVNTNINGAQYAPDIAMNASGTFAIAWSDTSTGYNFVQRYNSSGVRQGGETQVADQSGGGFYPSIAMDDAGNFVVSFYNGNIYAQRFNSGGVAQGSAFQVNTFSFPQYSQRSDAAMDASGNFVIAYDAYNSDYSNVDIYAQRYRSDGTAKGTELRNRTTAGTQIYPSVALDDAGRFILAWESDNNSTGDYDVYAEISPSNNAPTTKNRSEQILEDTPVDITLSARDEDREPISYIIVTPPTKGTLSGSGANRTYTPNANVFGSDSFTFKVNDGTSDSNISKVSFAIQSVNDAPVAQNTSASVRAGKSVYITLPAADVDNAALTYAASSAAHGTLTGNGNIRLYTPTAGYTGSDSFTFTANDGKLTSNIANVSINVTP